MGGLDIAWGNLVFLGYVIQEVATSLSVSSTDELAKVDDLGVLILGSVHGWYLVSFLSSCVSSPGLELWRKAFNCFCETFPGL